MKEGKDDREAVSIAKDGARAKVEEKVDQ